MIISYAVRAGEIARREVVEVEVSPSEMNGPTTHKEDLARPAMQRAQKDGKICQSSYLDRDVTCLLKKERKEDRFAARHLMLTSPDSFFRGE